MLLRNYLLIIKNKMKSLIVDAVEDKIILKVITKNKSYTNEYLNNRENFDRLAIIIFDFEIKSVQNC